MEWLENQRQEEEDRRLEKVRLRRESNYSQRTMLGYNLKEIAIFVTCLGLFLAAVGFIGFIASYNIDISVGGIINLERIDRRRFWSEFSGVPVVAGSVDFAGGFLAIAVLSLTKSAPESKEGRGPPSILLGNTPTAATHVFQGVGSAA